MNVRKIMRSSSFVVWLYSLLIWAYICARILVADDLTLWHLGVLLFLISAFSLWMFINLRGDSTMNLRQIVRSSALVVSLYSLLTWAYVVARLMIFHYDVKEPFIMGINISFWTVGISVFIISAISLWIFLLLRDDPAGSKSKLSNPE